MGKSEVIGLVHTEPGVFFSVNFLLVVKRRAEVKFLSMILEVDRLNWRVGLQIENKVLAPVVIHSLIHALSCKISWLALLVHLQLHGVDFLFAQDIPSEGCE